MKKVERAVKTDRFEAMLVYWEPESVDFYPSTPLAAAPPGGPFARIDGVDASIVMLLIQMIGGGSLARPRISHGGCGV